MATRTMSRTVAATVPPAVFAEPPSFEAALASAALAMSTTVTAVATASAIYTAQQRAFAAQYCAPRGPLEQLYGSLVAEVLDWCGLASLARCGCASRSLRARCYDPRLFSPEKVGLALRRGFPRPSTLGEARYVCAPDRPSRSRRDRAPLAAFVLGCAGGARSLAVDDDDEFDFEGHDASPAWVANRARYRKQVARSQRCLRALRETRRLRSGVEICYVSSVHDGAFVSRVSATGGGSRGTDDGPLPRNRESAPLPNALVHLSCGHSSWHASREPGASASRAGAAGHVRAAVDIEASALVSRNLVTLVCEHLVCDARLPTLVRLSVVALHAVRHADTPVDAVTQIQLVSLLGCGGLASLELRAPRAIATPPAPRERADHRGGRAFADLAAIAKRYLPRLEAFAVVCPEDDAGVETRSVHRFPGTAE